MFNTILQVESQICPVVFADSPTTRLRDREKMAEILFEKFNTPAYFVGSTSVLSIYSAGRTSGLVLDIGHEVSHAMAVHEGFAFPQTIGRLELGGMDISNNLMDILKDRGVQLSDNDYTAAVIADDMKKKLVRVAYDYAQEAQLLRTRPETAPW